MVIRVDVVDAALQAVYGADTEAMLAARRVAVLTAGRPAARRRARERAGRARAAHAALRPLRGNRRTRARAPRQRRDLDRPLRALGRRAGRDGGRRRGAAQAAGRARQRGERGRGVVLARRSRAGPSTRTTPGRPPTGAGRCPRCCCRATTSGRGAGACRRPASCRAPRKRRSSLTSRASRRIPRLAARPARGRPPPMSELIESIERRQLRRPSAASGWATACASTSRSSRAPGGAPRSSRES